MSAGLPFKHLKPSVPLLAVLALLIGSVSAFPQQGETEPDAPVQWVQIRAAEVGAEVPGGGTRDRTEYLQIDGGWLVRSVVSFKGPRGCSGDSTGKGCSESGGLGVGLTFIPDASHASPPYAAPSDDADDKD